jgi:hypothetical protein
MYPPNGDENATLGYAKWLPIYEMQRPCQIISLFPGEYKNTNLEFAPAPEPEVIRDMRGSESSFTIDEHGFQVVRQVTEVSNYTDKGTVETVYFAEMEELLKRELDDVDRVYIYDWRV